MKESNNTTLVYSRDGEVFYEDEGLMEDAREDWISGEPEDGGYYTGERKEINVANLVRDICVDEIIEHMDEELYDIVGDVAEDALSISNEKKRRVS